MCAISTDKHTGVFQVHATLPLAAHSSKSETSKESWPRRHISKHEDHGKNTAHALTFCHNGSMLWPVLTFTEEHVSSIMPWNDKLMLQEKLPLFSSIPQISTQRTVVQMWTYRFLGDVYLLHPHYTKYLK